jgi:hypothetical protein
MTELLTTKLEFGCACVDRDRTMCYALRYPNQNQMEEQGHCECECHDKWVEWDDLDQGVE